MKRIVLLATLFTGAALLSYGQTKVTTPKAALGFNAGDDYRLANYTQLEAYWKKLASESDRIKLADIGLTAEGRHQWMAIVSAPENLKNLARYKDIAQRLARAEGLSSDQARALAREGKAVVWIDGGLHATEVAGSQQLIEMVYQMLSRTDPETMRLLNDDIMLCVPANPDGMELVANWYMREKDETKRTMNGLPRLYEKYIGHDNNRDSLTSNMAETTNMNRQLSSEWNPQIMYNHHQSGPAGEVVFIPPFRDPVNHNLDPLVTLGIQAVGIAMHERLVAQGKGGSGMRTQANYDGWWDGGMRNTTTYHNTIAMITEIIGNPTPMSIPLVPERQLYISDLPLPVAPQPWHFRQTIDYLMETNRAILDYASRNREPLLYNIWRMGMNSIERGSKDYWTITPKRVEALKAAAGPSGGGRRGAQLAAGGGDAPGGGFGAASVPSELYEKILHDPAMRDPRGYVMPANQADFPTATRFVNSLLKNGITVLKANAAFTVAGKNYPAGSYVVKTAQAFRPFVRDMFEPQDHPRDDLFPGGPPIPPYDIAGWTLAMQMGVDYDRIFDGFDGPFVRLRGPRETPFSVTVEEPPAGSIVGPASPAGYLISHRVNNSFILMNRLLKASCDVYWMKAPLRADGQDLGTGAIWVPRSPTALPVLQKGARDLGITVHAVAQQPSGDSIKIKPVRIGLYDQYGGLMPSGWTRWLFEQFEFPFELVYPQTLDAGNLKSKFDVLVFTDGAMRGGRGGRGGGRGGAQADPQNIPEEYRGWTGRISEDKTIPQIKQFVESGGAVVTVGSSTSMAELLGVPMANAVAALPRDKFYIPGSLMRTNIDNTNPLAYGMPDKVVMFFDNSPVFRPGPNVAKAAWFSGPDTLESGWALGQQYLDGTTAVAEAKVGEGKVFVMGPEVTFRGEPHATFKFLFNGVFYAGTR
ncbi:Peptidase M14, carboxypeptidase A [Candidatus Sulfopaludibacter sp. SbA4]|nr:Peptidase M14, carboxypeptidase A [Candidatus Sulfopaludibacter sp. SbA4]